MKQKPIASLHVVTQDDPLISHTTMVREACQAGARWIQLRSKVLDKEQLIREGRTVRAICREFGAVLIVNDHPDVALEVQADGVHLGLHDMNPVKARSTLGESKIIGGTANTMHDIRKHHFAGVDYIGVGPYRFTRTKQNLSPILGLCGYHEIMERCAIEEIDIPLIAIGGITVEDLPKLKLTGVHGVAMAGAINYDLRKEKILSEIFKIWENGKVKDCQ